MQPKTIIQEYSLCFVCNNCAYVWVGTEFWRCPDCESLDITVLLNMARLKQQEEKP